MTEFRFDCEEDFSLLASALCGVAECDLPITIELLFVDEEEIRRLNREQRNVDRVTDVLSFPAAALEAGAPIHAKEHEDCVDRDEGTLLLGSVVICKKRAEEQAAEYGHSYARELNYLAVHGVLHCLGYDHEEEGDKAKMRLKEEEIMQKLDLGRGE